MSTNKKASKSKKFPTDKYILLRDVPTSNGLKMAGETVELTKEAAEVWRSKNRIK